MTLLLAAFVLAFLSGTFSEDACTPNPCSYGGTCYLATLSPGYVCVCNVGLHGQDCELFNAGQDCGGTFIDVSGTFTSPGFPDNYTPNENCYYSIRVAHALTVTLQFDTFNSEPNRDLLQVVAGPSLLPDSDNVLTFSGSLSIDPLTINSSQVTIRWSTDSQTQLNGFSIQYFTDTHSCFSSPCKNFGTCIDMNSGYICSCSPEYQGIHCELVNNPCDGSPCNNAGSCRSSDSSSFICECQTGWSGDTCDIGVVLVSSTVIQLPTTSIIENDPSISLNITVTPVESSYSVTGQDVWDFQAFFSSQSDGEGLVNSALVRLTSSQSSTSWVPPEPSKFNEVFVDGADVHSTCVDLKYLCIELLKQDSAPFELEGLFGQKSLIDCVAISCQGVQITQTLVTLRAGLLVEGGINYNTRLDVTLTSSVYSASITGNNLWKITVFTNEQLDGNGQQTVVQPAVLSQAQSSTALMAGTSVSLFDITVDLDLTLATCMQSRYICVQLDKDDGANPDFTLEGLPNSDDLIGCALVEDCKGVEITSTLPSFQSTSLLQGVDSQTFQFNVKFTTNPDAGSVQGSNLWKLTVFTSGQADGTGDRWSSTHVTMSSDNLQMGVVAGLASNLKDLSVTLDLSGLVCGQVRFICVELGKGDQAMPNFTFSGYPNRLSLIGCVQTSCGGVEITSSSVSLREGLPVIEQQSNTLAFDVIFTSSAYGGSVAGTNLWLVTSFISTYATGSGTRFAEFQSVIPTDQEITSLIAGGSLTLSGVTSIVDLTGRTCIDFTYFCVDISKGENASPDFQLEPSLDSQSHISCALLECEGVIVTSLDLTITSGNPFYFRSLSHNVLFNLTIHSDPSGADITGGNLWSIEVFSNTMQDPNSGFVAVLGTLTPSHLNTSFISGQPYSLVGLSVNFDLSTIPGCFAVSFFCVSVNRLTSREFTLSGFPDDTALQKCVPIQCETANPCLSGPCGNGATCINNFNDYKCLCTGGWNGPLCMTAVNLCASSPCQNGAVCNNFQTYYSCTCVPGWQGDKCEDAIDLCLSSPCANSGTCTNYQISYTCICAPGWQGSTCEQVTDLCLSSPCQNGAVCNNFQTSFTCNCTPGWEGPICSTAINLCLSAPCQNGAVCNNFQTRYTCSCNAGWEGLHCEQATDMCEYNICQNGATCNNLQTSYTCVCSPGWNGTFCQHAIDLCLSTPCQNGAVCNNFQTSYSCNCSAGWEGTYCEQAIDLCLSAPCQNEAVCNNFQTSYSCNCSAGWEGTYCEQAIDLCLSAPCQNGAVCNNFQTSYTCNCSAGWEGMQCEQAIDLCLSTPCQNGAVCNNFQTSYSCNCSAGWEGTYCEQAIDLCLSAPCQNEAVCNNFQTSYSCNCSAGWEGTYCEQAIDLCLSAPCQNGAVCNNFQTSYTCNCSAGWEGMQCEQAIDLCLSTPCQNGAVCNNFQTSYSCNCSAGWEGTYCEQAIDLCLSAPCQNEAVCNNFQTSYTCNCSAGWEGTYCEQAIDLCLSIPCQNGAVCNNFQTSYACNCSAGWEGMQCEQAIDLCLSIPCQNGAVCNNFQTSYTCNCSAGWEGMQCEQAIDLCLSTPCQNEAVCNNFQTSYSCNCSAGWEGTYCEQAIDLCLSAPCQNGAVCNNFQTSYTCNCSAGWEGTYCEQAINLCLSAPCQNGAVCNNFQTSYTCNCSAGWEGTYCEQAIDLCFSAPCQNGAVCNNFQTSYTCNCNAGWEGTYCEHAIDLCLSIPCQNGAVCNNFQTSYTCNCSAGWEGMQCEQTIDQCLSNPCKNGAVCNNFQTSYTCNCKSGWEGTYCEQAIDLCLSIPCQNGAVCNNFQTSYTCNCSAGWEGTYCEQAIDLCLSTPCQNGAVCNNFQTSYTCNCSAGWEGTFCEQVVDMCITSLCENGAGCINFQTFYICTCPVGWQGAICNEVVDHCQSDPCQNGAVCNNFQTSYNCSCVAGWEGLHCEQASNPCEPTPCQNGAVCNNFQTNFTCSCSAGWVGIYCEQAIDLCLSTPCKNGAVCNNFQTSFTCSCSAGWEGLTCEEEIDLCLTSPCQNGATCVNFQTSVRCTCPNGWQGILCDHVSVPCLSSPCMNNGLCHDFQFYYTCECLTGWLGELCEIYDPCFNNSCEYNGTCIAGNNGDFTCICPPGYSGNTCNILPDPCFSQPCQNGGICFNSVNDDMFLCRCAVGFLGDTCLYQDSCLSSPCLNGGICEADGSGFQCRCSLDFIGKTCQLQDPCRSSPCYNDATCQTDIEGATFSCLCSDGYVSPLCKFIDPCSSSPCQNSGICSILSGGVAFTCNCSDQYLGDLCQINNPCFVNPCMNGGNCLVDSFDGYTCECQSQFVGATCQYIDQCLAQPCLNAGVCSPSSDGASYYCSCLPIWQGINCQFPDLCGSNPCLNDATCTSDAVGSVFYCTCSAGFVGVLCERSDPCMSSPCENDAECLDTGSNFICACGSSHYGSLCQYVYPCLSNPCLNSGWCQMLESDTDVTFICLCPNGFKGELCQYSDPCTSTPCLNDGICQSSDVGSSYNCSCLNEFVGDTCQHTNQCLTNPCLNSGTCSVSNGGASYMCSCVVGWLGNQCQYQDMCSTSTCYNGGVCATSGQTYICYCTIQYVGPNCEFINPCIYNPCQNQGTCTPGNDGITTTCNCPPGFIGTNCLYTDPCYVNTCYNGATCVSHDDFQSFTCSCAEGYHGDRCQSLDVCFSYPCQNGGICVDGDVRGTYTCNCQPGFIGSNCQHISPCVSNPCLNQAICTTDLEGTIYQCICPDTYLGENCEIHNPCLPNKCENEGVCVLSTEPVSYLCVCAFGYDGQNCQNINSCASSPCLNQGTCSHGDDGSYSCICLANFIGRNCQIIDPCSSNTCQNEASCQPSLDGSFYQCICQPGYLGNNCDIINPCSSNPCQNAGICQSNQDGSAISCQCTSQYHGSLCQYFNACFSSPCLNNGNCNVDGSSYICTCILGYQGNNCQFTDPCISTPCENQAICKSINSSYECSCLPGYYGIRCQFFDVCNSSPCLNNGTCYSSSNGSYVCQCSASYIGIHCQISGCDPNPCLNGGTCENSENVNGFICSCPPDYSGDTCETYESSLCKGSPCLNGGTCIPLDTFYNCECTDFFRGLNCEISRPVCESSPCNSGTCTDYGTSYTCTCDPYYFGYNCEFYDPPVDNVPQFHPHPDSIYRLKENLTVGHLVLTLTGSDPEGKNVTYGIKHEEPSINYISVGPVNGEVRIHQQLDAETDLFFSATFTISDGTNTPVEASSLILVDDVNDFAPQFVDMPYIFNVNEDAPIDYLITTISTTDPDISTPKGAEYQLIEETSVISVDLNSGEIRLKQKLDHEITKTYQFTIRAYDFGTPPLENTTDLILNVQDVQDSSPVFVNTPYTASVKENSPIGVLVTTVRAVDQDTGVPNTISYSIVGGNEAGFFHINTITGNITVNSIIDREIPGFFGIVQLTVMATEIGMSGGANVSTTFSIMIEDVSDQAPTFSQSQYDVSISELAEQGQQLPLQIQVIDADLGTNADFTIRLNGEHSEVFSITPLQASGSTEVTLALLQSLDYESRTSYSLQIIATDTTNPTLNSQVPIMINVVNENDNAPTFDPSVTYFANLLESVDVGRSVLQVSAVDNDLGSLGQIIYTLTGSDRFQVNSTSGEISVAQKLNYEEQQNYLLTVTATDGGTPPRNSDKSVTINVLDVNDNAPEFTRELYEAHVQENEMYSVGREIISIRAIDPDVSSNNLVNYYFLQTFSNETTATSTSIDNFIISTADGSGFVYTLQPLDYESITSNPLIMTVVAEDSIGLRDLALLYIHVDDKNDNAPIFEKVRYEAIVQEDLANGARVLSVSATDSDGSALYGTPSILYSLKLPNSYFTINAVSGEILTIATLDADNEMETIEFEIIAMDGGQGSSKMSSVAMVSITITDVNDNDPVFVNNFITNHIPENATIGHQVAIVTVTDRDKLENNTAVTFSIIDGNDDGFFTIDPLNGNISVTTSLDFEATNMFTLTIRAEAVTMPVPPATGRASAIVEVFIQDVNDNSPIFSKQEYVFQVSEGWLSGVAVGEVLATDADSTINSQIQYSIISGNENELFTILDPSSGELSLTQQLDREASPSLGLTVRAQDLGQPSLSSEATVTILVLDINDNDPVWTQDTYSVNVTDGASPGLLLQVQATDSDEGKNSQLIYTIQPPNPDFFMNYTTGELFTVTEIDREESSFITLFVNVRDDGDVPRSAISSAQVSITVIDVNDNQPVTLLPQFFFTVFENSVPGTPVGMVQASDPDSSSSLWFSFVTNSPEFTININSGEITTKIPLDREAMTGYTLTTNVTDGKFAVQVPVNITVLDVNDNTPVFTQNLYNATVLENAEPGTSLIQVTAMDADNGINSLVKYSIFDGNVGNAFRIDSSTGQMQVAVALDRETTPAYAITIQATDSAETNSLTSLTLVIVTVIDINDNKPMFTESTYIANVAENIAMGASIVKVTATDSDEGVNADIMFSIINGNYNNEFTINKTTGQISRGINALDFELSSFHSLLVQAANQDGQQSTATVRITVEDINDEVPEFTQPLYQRPDLSENAQINDVVVVVSATDADTGNGGVVFYSIQSGNEMNLFHMDPTSGSLILTGTLDYETNRNYTLTVTATDQSLPNNVGYATVKIMIVNVNDEIPKFENTVYTQYILENVMAGHLVLQVTAIDRDGQAPVMYSIDANSYAINFFQINSSTGEIITKAQLDRETNEDISFTIFASDGVGRGSALFNVILLDYNDNKPIFDVGSEIEARFMENLPIGSLVTSFIATDIDKTGPNSEVLYSFISGNDNGMFHLSVLPDGFVQINTTAEIDREIKSSYLLNVSATDRGLPSQQNHLEILVIVEDANDNTPVFTIMRYSATIQENTVANMFVIQVKATDIDIDENGLVRYEITEGNPGVFSIDSVSGNITTTYISLDREATDFYNLTVVARDLGDPSMQISTYVNISVMDSNDNAPVFQQTSQSVKIIEGPSSVDMVVAMVKATDEDLGSSGNVKYSIVDGNADEKFIINSTTGVIKAVAPLDREQVAQYLLTILAIDQDSAEENRLTSTATVTVQVEDINDVEPTFPSSFIGPIIIPEGRPGEYIGTYTAQDSDLGLSGDIFYSLGNQSADLFSISTITGILSLKGNMALDYETNKEYNITILATDRGTPSLTGMMVLNLQVMDQNDNSPEFNDLPYRVSVAENVSVGASIFQVDAYDIDSAEFQPIGFSIQQGNIGNAFRMDMMTGTVFVNTSLDRETDSLYELLIAATDSVNNPEYSRTTTTTLTVTVLDVNELPLEFSTLLYNGRVQEGQPTGTLIDMVTPISAVDGDTSSGSDISYILLGRGSTFFNIDETTGVMTTASILDYEQKPYYYFNVQATQSGGDFAYATINITVGNINDEVPVFTQGVVNVSVAENTIPGSSVVQLFATDPDGYALTFKLDSGALDKFTIDSSGIILVASPLDFEQQRSFTLIVSASDSGVPPQTGYSTVNIQILDINDTPPQFTTLISNYIIQENSAQMLIGNVHAEDDDTTSNISYSVVSLTAFDGNSNLISDHALFQNFVYLDSMTGDIYVNEGIDREVAVRLEIIVNGRDLNSFNPENSDTEPDAVVRIEIQDENDNSPLFAAPIISQNVVEGTPINTVIVTITANDPDADLNGQVMYTLLNTTDVITVHNTTGQVTLTKDLDRETNDQFNFFIKASDAGTPSLSGYLQLELLVLDINDNNPVFNQTEYIVQIPENVMVTADVIKVTATDIDDGNFGTVEYSLSGGQGKFSIDKITGQVIVSAPLNTEEQAMYTVTVTARDNPSGLVTNRRESSAQVIITVEDVNEFPPLPSMDRYLFSVQENLPTNTLIGQVEADDPDNSPNQQLIFAIIASTSQDFLSLLRINSSSGEIFTTSSLDRESTIYSSSTTLTIDISDNGFPKMSSQALVDVTIEDVNDNSPTFSQLVYYANISEGSTIGNVVTKVSAVDPDQNTELTYRIISGNINNTFTIVADSGLVITAKSLDFETTRAFSLQIEVDDNDGWVSSTTLHVTVQDVNDNHPVFQNTPYEFTTAENVITGYEVGRCVAVDSDAGVSTSQISYSIIAGNTGEAFLMESTTGALKTTGILDRESVAFYSLIIQASNLDGLATTAQVSITIEDVNDVIPHFEPPSLPTYQLLESVVIGTFVVTVTANDEDEGANGQVEYSIINGNDAGVFTIDAISGTISTAKLLYEQNPQMFSFELTVMARDGGESPLSSTIVVSITVNDENNHQPVFVHPVAGMRLTVPENEQPGYLITIVSATDDDQGESSTITYGFDDSRTEDRDILQKFILDANTGRLLTNATFDRETQAVYTLIVTAQDNGIPRQTTQLEVIIDISDVDDNEPGFPRQEPDVHPVQSMSVEEGASVGTYIGTVMEAVDPDTAKNYYYFIVDGNDPMRFNLEKDSGELFVMSVLDREATSTISLIIKVSSDPNYMTTTRKRRSTFDLQSDLSLLEVLINLEDVNDNGPVFTNQLYIAGVAAEANIRTEIYTLRAVDADSVEHTSTEYAILATASIKNNIQAEADGTFFVEMKTGVVSLNKEVHKDAYEYFDITVRAIDTINGMASLAILKVYVLDPNERVVIVINAPIEEVEAKEEILKEVLSNITQGIVFIDDIMLYTTEDGKVNQDMTSVSINVIDPVTNQVMPAKLVISRIDQNSHLIDALFGIAEVYPLITHEGGDDWALMEIALIAIAILIFVGTLAFCIIVCCLQKSNRKKLSMRDAVSYGNAQNLMENDPYDYQGNPGFEENGSLSDNPIWLDREDSMSDWPDSISLIDSRQVPYRDASMDFFSTNTFDSNHRAKNGTIQNSLPPPPPPPGQCSSNNSEVSSIELLKQELAACGVSSQDPRAIPISESGLEDNHSGILTSKRVKEIHQMLEDLTAPDSPAALAAAAYRSELEYDNQLSTIAEEESSMVSSLTDGTSSLERRLQTHDQYATMRPPTIQEVTESGDISSESTSSSTQATVLSVTTYKLRANGDNKQVTNGHVSDIPFEDSEDGGCKRQSYTVNHTDDTSDDESLDSDNNSDISTSTAKQKTYIYTINGNDDSDDDSQAASKRLRVDMGGEVALSDDSSVELMQEISGYETCNGITNLGYHEEETHL